MSARRNSDGGTWHLTWKKTRKGTFIGWVVSKPTVRVEVKSLADLDDRLAEEITKKLQVGEWTAEWFPPFPPDEDELKEPYVASPDWVPLSGSGHSYYYFGDPRAYWTKGWCDHCGNPIGDRTDRPLDIYVEAASPLTSCGNNPCPNNAWVFREDLVDAIGRKAFADADLRPTNYLGRSNKRFYEVIAASTFPPLYYKTEYPALRCDTCGFTLGMAQMFDVPKLPASTKALWRPDSSGTEICVRMDWWKRNRRSPHCKGVTGGAFLVCKSPDAAVVPVFDKLHRPDCVGRGKGKPLSACIVVNQRIRATSYGIKKYQPIEAHASLILTPNAAAAAAPTPAPTTSTPSGTTSAASRARRASKTRRKTRR